MLKRISVVVFSLLLLFCGISLAASVDYDPSTHTYEFYHFAVRDYADGTGNPGDGIGDTVRYGFTMKDGSTPVPISNLKVSVNGNLDTNPINSSSYMWSWNGQNFQNDVYYGYNLAAEGRASSYDIELFGDDLSNPIASHTFAVPGDSEISPYDGFTIDDNFSYQLVDGAVRFSWGAPENEDHDKYRFTLSNFDGPSGYEIMYDLDASDRSIDVSNTLLAVASTWKVQFQTRDLGEAGHSVLRQYSNDQIVTVHQTPIPGAVWMLGSGLTGLVFLRRRVTNR